jgi:hypothetical protein
LAVMATRAEESIIADATATVMLVDPGPQDVNLTAGLWVIRQ